MARDQQAPIPGEVWRAIPQSHYEASSMGRVRTIAGHIYKPVIIRNYYHVHLCLADKRLNFRVHRLVCMAFRGLKPAAADCVLHINGNKLDNRIENLRWGTNKENAADTIAHGRQISGFDHPNVHISRAEAETLHTVYARHMEEMGAAGKKHARNGFILSLVQKYPHLGYKCVYKACRGAYRDFV